nr:unnamed protein product [Callosobruchus analis]
MSKVMETVINTQLLNYLDNNNIIHDRQYGFRKHRSTGDLLAYVTHMWNRAIENHGESRVVALDISKAFDRVWHLGLLAKLAAYGVSSGLCRWLNSFLHDRSLFVVVEGCTSDVFSINAGVPQGSVLSPRLYLLYINELLETTSNPIYSFADATTLTKKSLIGLPTVEMQGHPLVESPSIKLLGISISNNMSWHDHVATIAKTACQKLGVLFRCRRLYTPEQLLLLYKAQIRPSLEYCSHIWGCAPKHPLKLLDSIQNRAVRLIDTHNLTKDLHSLEHRRRVAGLSLFYRFYHGRCSSELSQIITPKAVRTRNTREVLHAHPYQVEVPTPRTSLLQHSFFWKTLTLWNELPGSLFPDGYNLQRLKRTTTTQKLEVLFRCRKSYTPEQLLLLYNAQLRPLLEYFSHVLGCAPKYSLLLHSIQKTAVRLIDAPNLIKDLHSLEHRRRVAGLSLFYRFYHGRCSSELSEIIKPKAVRTENTRVSEPFQTDVPDINKEVEEEGPEKVDEDEKETAYVHVTPAKARKRK